MQVRILFPDPGQGLEFQIEEVGILHIPVAPAEPDHGVVLFGFVVLPADKVAELVGAEVRSAVDHRPGCERSRNPAHCRGEFVDKAVLLALGDQIAGMPVVQCVGKHCLGTE